MRRVFAPLPAFGLLLISLMFFTPPSLHSEKSPKTPTVKEKEIKIKIDTIIMELNFEGNRERRSREMTDREFEELQATMTKKQRASRRERDRLAAEIEERRKRLQAAKERTEQARKSHDYKGQDYLKAEEEYKRETGSYENPDLQQYWTERVGEVRLADEEEQGSEGETPGTKALIKEFGQIQSAFGSGKSAGALGGFMDNKANRLKDITQKMLLDQKQKAMDLQNGIVAKTPSALTAPANTGPPPSHSQIKAMDLSSASRAVQRAREGLTMENLNKEILISEARDKPSTYAKRDANSEANLALITSESKFRSGDFEGALRDADAFIRLNPKDPRGYNTKATILNRLRRFTEAAEAAKTSLGLNPDGTEALLNLAWSQLHLKDYSGAVRTTTRLIALQPNNAQAYLMRAFAYDKLGRREAMLEDLRRASDLDERYERYYQKALNKEQLFNPDDLDSHTLLDPVDTAPAPTRNIKLLLGAIMVFVGAAVAALPGLLSFLAGVLPKPPNEDDARTASEAAQQDWPPAPARPVERPLPAVEDSSLIAGKYRLDHIIGHGGMGKVWEARDVSLDRRVAVKQTITHTGDKGSIFRKLYIEEARTLAGLHHPNIVDIFEIIDRPDGVYLVLEFVTGKTVQEMIVEEKRLSWNRSLHILRAVGAALTSAHELNIIHRDLKPSNIMVNDRGFIKLMDFGIARGINSKSVEPGEAPLSESVQPGLRIEHTQTLAGTPAYLCPEAYQGIVSPATDVFALGVCLYEFLTGTLPFTDKGYSAKTAGGYVPPSKRAPGIDPRADVAIWNALEPDLKKRIPSLREFVARLNSID